MVEYDVVGSILNNKYSRNKKPKAYLPLRFCAKTDNT